MVLDDRRRRKGRKEAYLPVRPTIATFSPGLIDKEKFEMTGSPGLLCQTLAGHMQFHSVDSLVASFYAVELDLPCAWPICRRNVVFVLIVLGDCICGEVLDPGHATNVCLKLRPEGDQ